MKNKKTAKKLTQKEVLLKLIQGKKWFSNKEFVSMCGTTKAKLSRRMSELDKRTLKVKIKKVAQSTYFRGY